MSFTLAYIIFTNINLYQAKYIQPTVKELAKYNFYLLGVYLFLNVLVTLTFSTGINSYKFPVWVVNIIYRSAAVLPTLIMTYLWYGQIPTSNQLLGAFMVLSGIILVATK